jgi:hypothetical protein
MTKGKPLDVLLIHLGRPGTAPARLTNLTICPQGAYFYVSFRAKSFIRPERSSQSISPLPLTTPSAVTKLVLEPVGLRNTNSIDRQFPLALNTRFIYEIKANVHSVTQMGSNVWARAR